jgi:hypothetical protein
MLSACGPNIPAGLSNTTASNPIENFALETADMQIRYFHGAALTAKNGFGCTTFLFALTIAAMFPLSCAKAQPGGGDTDTDQEVSDFHDAQEDAALAVGRSPVPQTNLFATAPAQEQSAPAQPFTANLMFPLQYNSNADQSRDNAIESFDWKADGRITYTANLAPDLRVSLQARADVERYPDNNGRNIDFTRQSLRLQYVNPNDDQAFSPYLAIVPRQDYVPLYSDFVSNREDLNLGVQKRFNFDARFNPLSRASRSGSDAVWSIGFNIFGQQRWRNPAADSNAVVFAPSISYKINSDWDFSLGGDLTRRWFERTNARQRADLLIEPIATLAYSIPDDFLGGKNNPFGSPVIEAQVSSESLESNQYFRNFTAFYAGLTFRSGWRF